MAIYNLRVADGVRRAGGAPGIELLMEIEIRSDTSAKFFPLSEPPLWSNIVTLYPQSLILPRIAVVGDEFHVAVKVLLNDLLNFGGNESLIGEIRTRQRPYSGEVGANLQLTGTNFSD